MHELTNGGDAHVQHYSVTMSPGNYDGWKQIPAAEINHTSTKASQQSFRDPTQTHMYDQACSQVVSAVLMGLKSAHVTAQAVPDEVIGRKGESADSRQKSGNN